jgi:hypothetical protein
MKRETKNHFLRYKNPNFLASVVYIRCSICSDVIDDVELYGILQMEEMRDAEKTRGESRPHDARVGKGGERRGARTDHIMVLSDDGSPGTKIRRGAIEVLQRHSRFLIPSPPKTHRIMSPI